MADALRPAVLCVEGPSIVHVWIAGNELRVVHIVGRTARQQHMASLIPDVAGGNRDLLRELLFHCGVISPDSRQSHLQRTDLRCYTIWQRNIALGIWLRESGLVRPL